jgi:hypothetical protein
MLGAHPEVAMLWEDRSYAVERVVGKQVVGNKLCVPNQIRRHTTWYERLFRRYGWRVYREKSFVSIEHYLRDADMRLLLIVRTPSAVVSSIVRRGGLSPDRAVARWSEGISILDRLEQTAQARCLPLQFEELLQSPRATLGVICDFLGLAFDQKMLDGHKHTRLYNQHGGIDASKATSSTGGTLDMDLRQAEPDAFARYQRLCRRATATLN